MLGLAAQAEPLALDAELPLEEMTLQPWRWISNDWRLSEP